MAFIYINHSKNGLYVAVDNDQEKNFRDYKIELTPHIILKDDIIDTLCTASRFLKSVDEFQMISKFETDQTLKSIRSMKSHLKDYCDNIYSLSDNISRMLVLKKMFLGKLPRDDRSEMFLKLVRGMFTKEDYDFVIRYRDRYNKEDPVMTFNENDYIEYVKNKMDNSDFSHTMTIENIRTHNVEKLMSSIEESYYESSDFDKILHDLVKSLTEKSPGIFFKKLSDGVPFGMWILLKTVETENNNLIVDCRKKIGQLFFDDEHIFVH